VEKAVRFLCDGKKLYGVLHVPETKNPVDTGVIIVNGGPQTRVGSHRIYVLLARFLSSRGHYVLRFDYEGLGDSEGSFVGFQHAGPSIGVAVEALGNEFSKPPNIILWSICNGATASAIWASGSQGRISGLILCNPFVFNAQHGMGDAFLKHYYAKRFFDKELWTKVFCFRFNFIQAWSSFYKFFKNSSYFPRLQRWLNAKSIESSLEERFFQGIRRCGRPAMLILSENDIVARYFMDFMRVRKDIAPLVSMGRVRKEIIKGADHTFTSLAAKKELFATTANLIDEILKSKASSAG
jgi:exosortase A-associated hydrolase 1